MENLGEAFVNPFRKIAQEVVRAEIRSFREQLEAVCLHAVEAAFERFSGSAKFLEAVRGEVKRAGAGAEGLDETVKGLVAREVRERGDPRAAFDQYLTAHGADLLKNEAIQIELNSLVLNKAKELFKRSAFSGSLDIKMIVTRVVESVLEARGLTETKAQDVQQAVAQVLRDNLSGMLAETVNAEIRSLLASDDMKELLDSKFRAIDLYLKTELIPKVVKREIALAMEASG